MDLDSDGEYPFREADGRELHLALTYLYPTPDGVFYMAESIGISRARLRTQQRVVDSWRQVLSMAPGYQGKLRQLVQTALDEWPESPQSSVLEAVLEGRPVERQAEPRLADGRSSFFVGSEILSRDEALLFRQDLTIPVGSIVALIATLGRLLELSKSVCRLCVETRGAAGPSESTGTGFRIAADLVLTNHHVLHVDGANATKVGVFFGFDTDHKGSELTSERLEADPTSIQTDAANDWGLIRVPGIGDAWPTIDLSSIAAAKENEPAYIVQHPGGKRKRLGFVRNTVTNITEQVVHYLTDTQPGSSGAPVFNADGRLIAVHHRGGTPTSLMGKAPTCKNEGIRIERILEALAARRLLPNGWV